MFSACYMKVDLMGSIQLKKKKGDNLLNEILDYLLRLP